MSDPDASHFTWSKVGLSIVLALIFGAIWVSQPDVGLESIRDVTLEAGNGLYFEAKENGELVYTKGPTKPTHLFSRIVKRRGWRTYIYLQTHFGTFLRYNRELRKIDASGSPEQFGHFDLDDELLFVEWRSGRITHPLKEEDSKLVAGKDSNVPSPVDPKKQKGMSLGESPDKGDYEGDLVIDSQEALNKLFGYSGVNGDIRIVGTQLENLASLRTLRRVGGSLVIADNPRLKAIYGVRGISAVDKDIIVSNNPELKNLQGLSSIGTVEGKVRIANNGSLTGLNGAEAIRSKGPFELVNNRGLGACAEDILLRQSAFEKSRAELLAHRIAREGWEGEKDCKEPLANHHELTQEVLDRALKKMSEAMARLDLELERAGQEQEKELAKMDATNKRMKSLSQSENEKSKENLRARQFLMPTFGNEPGATAKSPKDRQGQLRGPCVFPEQNLSPEERRKKCQLQRKNWRKNLKKPAYVYVLESLRNPAQRHIEWGPEPSKRERMHTRGLIPETAHLAPWNLIYRRKFPTGSRAKDFVDRLRRNIEKEEKERLKLKTAQKKYLKKMKRQQSQSQLD